jgi:dihydroorotase
MTTLRIRRPDDFHVHLRQGEILAGVLPATALTFGRALVMPNTLPPILTAADAVSYRQAICVEIAKLGADHFHPLMTIKLVSSTTPQTILAARAAGVVAGKLYPEGVTTNSEDGVRDLEALYPVFEQMQACEMVLCLHGESPGVFCMDREQHFALSVLPFLAGCFPKLRIVLEHVTTAAALRTVESLHDKVAATVTPHHLLLTLDDVVGDKLQPHHFCKPIAKTPQDRDALIAAAVSGNPKFFLGTDSAPHPRDQKECASGCAGVFCAPVAMEVLAEVFEQQEALPKLEALTSEFGARFYGLPLNDSYVQLVREPYAVPQYIEVGDTQLAPFRAATVLNWLCQIETS